MTEAEWLACDDPMRLWFALPRRSRRVSGLFAVACVRATPEPGPLLLSAADEVELAAETGDWAGVEKLNEQVSRMCQEAQPDSRAHFRALAALRLTTADTIDYYAVHVPFFLGKALAGTPGAADLSRHYTALIRDTAGRPGRNGRGKRMKAPTKAHPFPVLRLSHLTAAVLALAGGIYADRAFDRLPILADALQDAGCDDAAILDHCRGQGPHVRGCWVADLVLGKD